LGDYIASVYNPLSYRFLLKVCAHKLRALKVLPGEHESRAANAPIRSSGLWFAVRSVGHKRAIALLMIRSFSVQAAGARQREHLADRCAANDSMVETRPLRCRRLRPPAVLLSARRDLPVAYSTLRDAVSRIPLITAPRSSKWVK